MSQNSNIFSPGYRIEIKNEKQARIYNRFMYAKIAVQLIILAGLLALSGWNWQMFAAVGTIAAVWQFGPRLLRRLTAKRGAV
jgi:hypothetical protein